MSKNYQRLRKNVTPLESMTENLTEIALSRKLEVAPRSDQVEATWGILDNNPKNSECSKSYQRLRKNCIPLESMTEN